METLTQKEQSILELYLKFNEEAKNELKSLIKINRNITNKTLFRKLKPLMKKPISDDIINLFYTDPVSFFNNYKKLLKNTSYFDKIGFSIFHHYFYVLYEYKRYEDSYINKNNFQFEVYESNFESFFKEEGKYLSIQDLSLETPLHKLAKLKDKKFFLEICQKLKNINLLNDELLSINDINFKTCFDYIVEHIENKTEIIIKNDFEIIII